MVACVWDRHQGDALQQLHRSSQPLYALDWRPGTSELAIGHDGTLEYWNIPEARLVRQLPIPNSPVVMAHDLHGTRVAVAGRQRTLVSLPVDSPGPLREMIGSPGSVEGLAFHPTENRLASASNDGWVRIWDNRSGRELITLPCVHAPGGAVVWSRDGRTLVGLGPQLRLWHAPR
jgi:WD40 repeat protein